MTTNTDFLQSFAVFLFRRFVELFYNKFNDFTKAVNIGRMYSKGGSMGQVFDYYWGVDAKSQLGSNPEHLLEGQIYVIVLLDFESGEFSGIYCVRLSKVTTWSSFDAVLMFEGDVITGEPSGLSISGYYGPLYELQFAALRPTLLS